MLREAGRDVRVGGNIGEALTGLVDGATDETVFVAGGRRASSSRASTRFHPKVAVFLNLSADHLDRHASFEEYAPPRRRIFENQTSDGLGGRERRRPGACSRARPGAVARVAVHVRAPRPWRADGAFFEAGHARSAATVGGGALPALLGPPSRLAPRRCDLLAAAAAARLLGAPADASPARWRAFRGVEHVLERVADDRRRARSSTTPRPPTWTRPARAWRPSPARARDPRRPLQGRRLRDLGRALARPRARRVLAIGEARDRVAAALAATRARGRCATRLGEAVRAGVAAAVARRRRAARPGLLVLRHVPDYAERGRAFKDEVRARSRMAEGLGRG